MGVIIKTGDIKINKMEPDTGGLLQMKKTRVGYVRVNLLYFKR